jgi:hypothetical protein
LRFGLGIIFSFFINNTFDFALFLQIIIWTSKYFKKQKFVFKLITIILV